MFETMQSFLAFFFPTLALILLGIVFEEKLISFEQKLFAALFGKSGSRRQTPAQEAAQRTQQRPALRRLDSSRQTTRNRNNRAA